MLQGTELSQILNQIFHHIWLTGCNVCFTILIVLLLRRLLKNAPKSLCCLLWALVALKLVCPYKVEISVPPVTYWIDMIEDDVNREISERVMIQGLPEIFETEPDIYPEPSEYTYTVFPEGATDITESPIENNAPAPLHAETVHLLDIISGLWLSGVLLMIAYALIQWIRLHKKLQVFLPISSDVRECDYISSPFIFGIAHPYIYVPSGLPKEQLRFVLAHEYVHIRRKDYLWKFLGEALLCVYWFHPLIWIAYSLFCEDIELACDEAVIRNLNKDERFDYAQALLRSELRERMMFTYPVAFGKVSIRNRVMSTIFYRRPGRILSIAGITACLLLTVITVSKPRHELIFRDITGHVKEHSVSFAMVSDVKNTGSVVSMNAKQCKQLDELFVKIERERIAEAGNFSDAFDFSNAEYLYSLAINNSKIWIAVGHEQDILLGCYDNAGNASAEKVWLYSNNSGELNDALQEMARDFSNRDEDRGEKFSTIDIDLEDWMRGLEIILNSESQSWFDNLDGNGQPDFLSLGFNPCDDYSFTIESLNRTILISSPAGITRINGLPIWNAIFTDLNGDAVPELCCTVTPYLGGNKSVVVADVANHQIYTLDGNGVYDYTVSWSNSLPVVKRFSRNDEGFPAEYDEIGFLLLRDGELEFDTWYRSADIIPSGPTPDIPPVRSESGRTYMIFSELESEARNFQSVNEALRLHPEEVQELRDHRGDTLHYIFRIYPSKKYEPDAVELLWRILDEVTGNKATELLEQEKYNELFWNYDYHLCTASFHMKSRWWVQHYISNLSLKQYDWQTIH